MYHEDWIDEIHVNEWAVFNRAKVYDKKPSKALKTLESLLLLKTITLLDLSTLFGDDSFSNVTALVNKVNVVFIILFIYFKVMEFNIEI